MLFGNHEPFVMAPLLIRGITTPGAIVMVPTLGSVLTAAAAAMAPAAPSSVAIIAASLAADARAPARNEVSASRWPRAHRVRGTRAHMHR